MEVLRLSIEPEMFDKAVHGGLDQLPTLPDGGDLALYVKPKATQSGKAGVVLTFTVQMPDGSMARVQTVTTAALLEQAGAACRGWREGGHI